MMDIRARQVVRVAALAAALSVPCISACGEAGSDVMAQPAGTGADAGPDTGFDPGAPTLYLDQVAEQVDADGSNPLREGYRARKATCQASGAPTTLLSEEEEARLGTERRQTWRDGKRFAYRHEAWVLDVPGQTTRDTMCAFALRTIGQHTLIGPDHSVSVDLENGERLQGDGNPSVVLVRRELDVDEEADAARAAGLSGPTPRTVAGLPCDEWTTMFGSSVCVWSGGTRWGMTSVPASEVAVDNDPHHDMLVLALAPPPGRSGMRLETVQATLGGPLDEGRMIPRGLP